MACARRRWRARPEKKGRNETRSSSSRVGVRTTTTPSRATTRPELDAILRACVEEDRSVHELVALGFDAETVAKVTRMVDRNEYKRRQGPIGVKITPRAFGRDWRLPLVDRFRE